MVGHDQKMTPFNMRYDVMGQCHGEL